MNTIQISYYLMLAIALSGCATPRFQAARQGRADARKELESGLMAIEVCGYSPVPEKHTQSEKYLMDRGVQIRLVGGCMPGDEVIGHAEGYNEVMMEGMKKKLGSDILIRAGYE